jgi:hypothetical protein
MLLPSPKKYAKSFKNRMLTHFANRMVDSILLKMWQAGYIGEEEYFTQLNGRFAWEKIATTIEDPSEDLGDEDQES